MEKSDFKWIIPIAIVCLVVFANSVGGGFVYDDNRQILRNTLIQDNSLLWKALTSDVWAFKGDGSIAASNYWRPTFTLWHIINFRLFGTSPLGWHITNIVLHSGVCVMAYAMLRRWAFSAMTAFAIVIIFAVHPVHTESVAWISGSPDLLFSLAFLASLWFAQSYAETNKNSNLFIAILLYAAALGAKEIGIICLPIYYLVFIGAENKKKKRIDAQTPLLAFATIAIVYFLMRWGVLGAISHPPDDAVGIGNAVMSIPAIFAFYLKQIFFPYPIAVNYPLEPVSQIGAENFFIPLVVTAATLTALFYLVRSHTRGKLAAAIFLLPLIPAMNATAFISDQMVHDRYLYLPLLGMLMLIVPFAVKFLDERYVMAACVAISILLSVQTFMYNRAWENDLTLWSWTSSIDNSTFTSMQYGNALAEVNRNEESINAYTAAIEKRPLPRGFIGRGRVYLKTRQYAKAQADLEAAANFPREQVEAYALYQAYEALGLAYSEQKKYQEAVQSFSEARIKLPIYAAALTNDLAVILYQSGQKDAALTELENGRDQARKELLPESKDVFLRLGMLYQEMGRKDDARTALNEYMDLTASIKDKKTTASRAQATKLLDSLNK
ncbi:MAG: hypothetical protein IPL32_07390 [Chloracidobacterium sp.]|nr:hypothetical protein [Chloracidobacterium sp.]